MLLLTFCYLQIISQTKDNVEKKQSLTYEEIEAEREEVIMCFVVHTFILLLSAFVCWISFFSFTI